MTLTETILKTKDSFLFFRYYVIFKLPRLRFLDSRPVSESERTEAKRVGALMRVVKADETVRLDFI